MSWLKTSPCRSSWPRPAVGAALAMALTVGFALPAVGATRKASARAQTSFGAERNTFRLLRQMPADQAEPVKAAAATTEDGPWSITMGVSRDRASTGRTVSTPFAIGRTSDDWYLEASGDGYLDAANEGERSCGLADIALVLNHTHKFGKGGRYGLTPEFELDLPSHGAVGSTHASQALRLTLSRFSDVCGWAAGIGLARAGNAEPDASRYTKTASLKLSYDLRPDTTTGLKLSRSLQAGAPAGNKLSWDLQFRLPATVDPASKHRKVWSATIGLSRARSAGTSSHGVGLDIGCAF